MPRNVFFPGGKIVNVSGLSADEEAAVKAEADEEHVAHFQKTGHLHPKASAVVRAVVSKVAKPEAEANPAEKPEAES